RMFGESNRDGWAVGDDHGTQVRRKVARHLKRGRTRVEEDDLARMEQPARRAGDRRLGRGRLLATLGIWSCADRRWQAASVNTPKHAGFSQFLQVAAHGVRRHPE